ncbi:MAG: hypothetical protein OXD43_09235 [Bacteroidetes bacterium]|nr:hypothetical protein [Bacteroidota bacterium]
MSTFRQYGEDRRVLGSERHAHQGGSPGYWRWHAWKIREAATREALSVLMHTATGTPRGADWADRVTDGSVVPQKRGNACGGKGP